MVDYKEDTNEIKFSPNTDVEAVIIDDVAPERLIRVYPYEFTNSSSSRAFIKQNGVSLATVSQAFLDTKEEFLYKDENGNKYFEMIAAITSNGKLDVSTATSVYGQELKEEDSFLGLCNWYYEGELESLQIGLARFMPAMFTIGKPFVQSDYEAGTQAAFIPSSMVEAKEGQSQYLTDEINPEGLYEFNCINITTIESQFVNVRIIPTFQNFAHAQFSTNINSPKFVLHTSNSTLINHVKLRANYSLLPDTSQYSGQLDLYSMNKIAPIQFTPTSISDNVEMYCDWFNYDNVMPWAYAQNFRANESGDKAKQLEKFITDPEDVKLINAMLYTTAAFADSLSAAPRYSDSDAHNSAGIVAGKIKADFKIFDLVGTAIDGKEPVKVVDGLYEKHIRDYPDFLLNRQRVQKVNMVLAALSRYIYSKHSIGRGQNEFNSLYLPWFLEPAEKIDYNSPRDKELTFNLKTNYYKTNFTSKQDFEFGTDFSMPERVNISSQILLRSDRPTTLPQINDTITAISKLPLAGDVNTSSAVDLQTLFFVQIDDPTDMMKMFIDTDAAVISPGKSETKKVGSFTVEQPFLSETQAKALILAKYDGTWEVQGTVTLASTTRKEPKYESARFVSEIPTMNPQNPNESKQTWKYPDGTTVTITSNYGFRRGPVDKQIGTQDVTLWTIGESTIIKIFAGETKSYSIQERQLIFDKQEWQWFIHKHGFKINPSGLQLNFEDYSYKVNILEEMTIGCMWADYITLKVGTMDAIRIPMFNKDDETIGIQRILFT